MIRWDANASHRIKRKFKFDFFIFIVRSLHENTTMDINKNTPIHTPTSIEGQKIVDFLKDFTDENRTNMTHILDMYESMFDPYMKQEFDDQLETHKQYMSHLAHISGYIENAQEFTQTLTDLLKVMNGQILKKITSHLIPPINGYHVFISTKMEEVKKQGVRPVDLMKVLDSMWHRLSEENRQLLEEKANLYNVSVGHAMESPDWWSHREQIIEKAQK